MAGNSVPPVIYRSLINDGVRIKRIFMDCGFNLAFRQWGESHALERPKTKRKR
jgi:hypothetical protein